jgi:hypothetical protein
MLFWLQNESVGPLKVWTPKYPLQEHTHGVLGLGSLDIDHQAYYLPCPPRQPILVYWPQRFAKGTWICLAWQWVINLD